MSFFLEKKLKAGLKAQVWDVDIFECTHTHKDVSFLQTASTTALKWFYLNPEPVEPYLEEILQVMMCLLSWHS